MTKTQTQNYTGPFITMVFLFFIIGFLTVVNQQFQSPLQHTLLEKAGALKNTLATMITFSWFLAYPLTGGIGAKWVSKFGYKGTLSRALLVMIAGLGVFEISVLLADYAPNAGIAIQGIEVPFAYFIFLVGSYVVGSAVTIMQVVVNPYLIACNVKGTSDIQRQNIGGSANSIGTTIAPYFVAGIIFGNVASEDIHIGQLIWPFIGLMATIAIITFIIGKLSLPNIEGTTNEANEKLERSIWSFRHLALGVIALFFYVGVEVSVGANVKMYADTLPLFKDSAAIMVTLYWGLMLVGRLVGASLNMISARTQLLVTTALATLLILLSMIIHNPWLLVIVGLFHSVMWSAIFTLAIAKLGKYTSKGSGALMIGVLGGGIMPLLQGVIADAMGGDWTWTWWLVLVGEIFMLYYALVGYKPREKDIIAK
ncbi:MAG TPA: MFS transporter [Candidatus Avirikenella pullistercoris]|nr:MFS transporter [Candidatus Avirikenella pullistercoris]